MITKWQLCSRGNYFIYQSQAHINRDCPILRDYEKHDKGIAIAMLCTLMAIAHKHQMDAGMEVINLKIQKRFIWNNFS